MTVQETTIASTLHDHRSPADVCRARGWTFNRGPGALGGARLEIRIAG